MPRRQRLECRAVRIALVSPYSWTYPGGVTRHIEALAAELARKGHEPRILAPFDPDDALSRRLHRGARPQRREPPENFVLARPHDRDSRQRRRLQPRRHARTRCSRCVASCARGGYDVAHIHEPVVPLDRLGRAAVRRGSCRSSARSTPTPRTRSPTGSRPVVLGGRRRMNRLHVRIAVSEAAAWTARRFYGGRYRIIPNGVRARRMTPEHASWPAASDDRRRRRGAAAHPVHRPSRRAQGPAGAAARVRGAARAHPRDAHARRGGRRPRSHHMMLDDRGVRALGKVSEERKLAELGARRGLCARRRCTARASAWCSPRRLPPPRPCVASDIPGYRDVVRDGIDGLLVPPGDALALAEALRATGARTAPARRDGRGRARARRALLRGHTSPRRSLDCYEEAIAVGRPGDAASRGSAVRHGFAPADLRPRVPAERLPRLASRRRRPSRRRALRVLSPRRLCC